LIPEIVGGEGAEAVEAATGAGGHAAAGALWGAAARAGGDLEIDGGGGALAGVGVADGDGEEADSARGAGGGELR